MRESDCKRWHCGWRNWQLSVTRYVHYFQHERRTVWQFHFIRDHR